MNLHMHGFVCYCKACKLDLDVTNLKICDTVLVDNMAHDSFDAMKDSVKKSIEQLKKNWMYVRVHHKNFQSHSVPFLIQFNKGLIMHIARSASYPKFGIGNLEERLDYV